MKTQAVMIVLERDGKFLLGKRSMQKAKAPGYWCPISGHIEQDESEQEAVIREAKEEIGVEVKPLRKIACIPTHDLTVMLHWWTAEIISGDPAIKNHENSEIKWFSREELMKLEQVFREDIDIILKLSDFR